MPSPSIRPINFPDIPSVFQLYQSVSLDRNKLNQQKYQRQLENQGFLLGVYSLDSHYQFLKLAKVYLAYEVHQQIIGYIVGRHEITYQNDRYRTWQDLEAKEIYYHHPQVISITSLAVHPHHLRQGIGSQLLQAFEQSAQTQGYRFLGSTVTISPIFNYPSLYFHQKHGFKKISTSQPHHAYNLPNYASSLFFKKM